MEATTGWLPVTADGVAAWNDIGTWAVDVVVAVVILPMGAAGLQMTVGVVADMLHTVAVGG